MSTLTKKTAVVGKRYRAKTNPGDERYSIHYYYYIADENISFYIQPWDENTEVLQEGHCSNCIIILKSWAKHVVCPKCGQFCYLT